MIQKIKGVSFVWNDEIKQNIINELNEQFDSVSPISPVQNHSYADSIFSPSFSNLYRPIDVESCSTPNYFEKTINSMRTIKEIPVHTMAFADSFNRDENTKYGYKYDSAIDFGTSESYFNYENEAMFNMDSIINSPNAVTFSLTPEQRNVAIAKCATWKNIMFDDVSLIRNTSFGRAVKNFCSIQIKF